jgi:release factor glutamine methyltransferase
VTTAPTREVESIRFGDLTIRFDERVLRPRPWTEAQSRWAAALLDVLPPGSVLELCTGAGQIGLAAVARPRRRLVCVDIDPVASKYAVLNARAAGLAERVEVRTAPMADAVDADEEFVLVIADPPWVTSDGTSRYPEDPLTAIDGGTDGLRVARDCVDVIGRHLATDGEALLQLASESQVTVLGAEIAYAGLRVVETRRYDGGVVAHLARR